MLPCCPVSPGFRSCPDTATPGPAHGEPPLLCPGRSCSSPCALLPGRRAACWLWADRWGSAGKAGGARRAPSVPCAWMQKRVLRQQSCNRSAPCQNLFWNVLIPAHRCRRRALRSLRAAWGSPAGAFRSVLSRSPAFCSSRLPPRQLPAPGPARRQGDPRRAGGALRGAGHGPGRAVPSGTEPSRAVPAASPAGAGREQRRAPGPVPALAASPEEPTSSLRGADGLCLQHTTGPAHSGHTHTGPAPPPAPRPRSPRCRQGAGSRRGGRAEVT